jgi:peptidoglycan/LPS O-acetylase OafA/YrhL
MHDTSNTSALKHLHSAAFVILFVFFLSVDVFHDWILQHLHCPPLVVNLLEWAFFLSALALFIACVKRMPASGAALGASRDPLVKRLRDTDDPLLILRCFAFFCVVVTHCYIVLKPEIRSSWDFLLQGCAHSGMIIFFCLSGYLMGKAFYSSRYVPDRFSLKSFYVNRAIRVVPLCYFASFVVTLFVSPDLLRYEILKQLWRPLLFLYYGNQPGPIGALWAVSVEMQYYVIAPFIFILLSPLLTSGQRTFKFIIIVLLSGFILKYSLSEIGTDWYTHRYTPLLANLDFFLVGYGINPLIERDKQSIGSSNHYRRNIVAAVLLCLLIYPIASGGEYSQVQYLFHGKGRLLSRSVYRELLTRMVVVMAFFCILNVERYKIRRKYLPVRQPRLPGIFVSQVSRVLQVAGVLTYGLYVWHSSILMSYARIVPQSYHLSEYLFYCASGMLLVLLLTLTTYFVIERPVERYRA